MDESLRKAIEDFLTAFRNCEAVRRHNEAKEAYLSDGHLLTLVAEYNMQGQILRDEGAKPERDEQLIAEITARLKDTYDEIMRDEKMAAFTKAQDEITAILQDINKGIQSIVQPESVEGGACSGQCSTCGGCR